MKASQNAVPVVVSFTLYPDERRLIARDTDSQNELATVAECKKWLESAIDAALFQLKSGT